MTTTRLGSALRGLRGSDTLKNTATMLGVSITTVADIENGRRTGGLARLVYWESVFGLATGTLVRLALQDQLDRAGVGFVCTLEKAVTK